MKKVVRIKESDLVRLVKQVIKENEEHQSFSDKIKQKLLFLTKFKLTDEIKFKLFEFGVRQFEKGNYSDNADLVYTNSVGYRIYINSDVIVNGIKINFNLYVRDMKKVIKNNKISSDDVFVDVYNPPTKGSNDLGLIDPDSSLFKRFERLVINTFSKNEKYMSLLDKKIDNSAPFPHKPKDNIIYVYDDDYHHHHHRDHDNDRGFGGFGGGSFGGAGAGGNW